MKPPTTTAGRLIVADDNIRDTGGHFFELASLLLDGAEALGYRGVLATHAEFDQRDAVGAGRTLVPTFHTRRLVHWSLGVDGNSRFQRDPQGRSIGGSPSQNAWSNLIDRLRPKRNPQQMLRQWSDDLRGLLERLRPTEADSLLINTGDDFAMLALAHAMQAADLPPIRIDVLFHFALHEPGQPDTRGVLRQIGRQLRAAAGQLSRFDLHLHATTQNLAAQLRQTESGLPVRAVPYPTRPSQTVIGAADPPWRIVLAGLPRAEKGKQAIAELLTAIDSDLLRSRRFQISMQMPAQRWQSMVPSSLQRAYRRAADGDRGGPLEVMTDNLTTEDYHAWLDTADVGLFLYQPQRYVARCSGVLLEMLARGVPVIVPDGCWLADQVRAAGGHRSIGLIYQDRAEIPDLLQQFARHREAIRGRAAEHAARVRSRHSGKSTLLEMGLSPADPQQQAA